MTDREKLFGTDLGLGGYVAGLDLRPDAAGDLALARGNRNIEQALLLRLRVRLGALAPLGWPDYGSRLHELIGEPNTTRTHVLLMAFARSAVERDPRVVEISGLAARVLPGERDVVRLEMDVQLLHEANPLNLVFDVNLEAP